MAVTNSPPPELARTSESSTPSPTILRLPGVIARTGKSRSTIYAECAAGLFPRPVRLGPRAVGWPAHEVDEILTARIAGASDDAICRLVSQLTVQRLQGRSRHD
jgi:prophage regulatory protein